MNHRMALVILFPALWILINLVGCETHPFSGSAAMRIDVEVYKGPLSEEPLVQWSNLWGLLDQADRGLIETDNFVRAVFANKGFHGKRHDSPNAWPLPRLNNDGQAVTDSTSLAYHGTTEVDKVCHNVQAETPWYYLRFWRLFGVLDDVDHFDCLMLVSLIKDMDLKIAKIKHIKIKYSPLRHSHSQSLSSGLSIPEGMSFLADVATLASDLKFNAFRWSVASGGGASLNRLVRIAQVTVTVTTSEYGNQLNARVDALLKQLKPNGLDRRELPPSVALREAEPTDFVHLYEWLNANDGRLGSILAGTEPVSNRVKIIDRLFADHFWSKTNTVYASGRGNVAMAFIKDDVGNWSLKSFDNNPEELLKTYTDFSIDTIKKAATIVAKAAAPDVGEGTQAAAKLITMATNTAFGKPISEPVTRGPSLIAALRRGVLLQLSEREKECEKVSDSKKASDSEKPSDSEKNKLDQCLRNLATLVESHGKIVDEIAKGLLANQQSPGLQAQP